MLTRHCSMLFCVYFVDLRLTAAVFWVQKKINRKRKQGLQAETRLGCTFPEKNDIRPTRIHNQVPVTERAVLGLRPGQISVQPVREWP